MLKDCLDLYKTKLLFAYFATYFVWGSTPFAIVAVVREIPPVLSSAMRYFIAGSIITLYCMAKKAKLPSGHEWCNTIIVAVLLLSLSNSCTCIGCKYLPSSIVAVIQGTIPLMMIIMDGFYFHMEHQTILNYTCAACGILGVALLVMTKSAEGFTFQLPPTGIATVLMGSFFWSLGSMLVKRYPRAKSSLFNSGIAMLISVPFQIVISSLMGERTPAIKSLSAATVWSFAYLVIFGSIIAFCSYNWLIAEEPPSRVGSISFVNPLVALWLGISFGKEAFNSQMAIGTTMLLLVIFALWVQKIKTHKKREATIRC